MGAHGTQAPHSARARVGGASGPGGGGGGPPFSARGSSADKGPERVRGAFNVSCTSSKHPREIMTEMVHTLSLHRVSFKQVSQWSMKCQRQTLRFEIDIAHLDDLDTIYVLRFKRVAGDLAQYKSLCSQLLAEMRL